MTKRRRFLAATVAAGVTGLSGCIEGGDPKLAKTRDASLVNIQDGWFKSAKFTIEDMIMRKKSMLRIELNTELGAAPSHLYIYEPDGDRKLETVYLSTGQTEVSANPRELTGLEDYPIVLVQKNDSGFEGTEVSVLDRAVLRITNLG